MAEKKTKPTEKKSGAEKLKAPPKVASKPKAIAAKKAVVKIPVTKTAVAKKFTAAAKEEVTPKMSTAKKVDSAGGKSKVVKHTPEERYRMVEMAAYFIAEKHGFQGRSDEHWAAAERVIAFQLGQ